MENTPPSAYRVNVNRTGTTNLQMLRGPTSCHFPYYLGSIEIQPWCHLVDLQMKKPCCILVHPTRVLADNWNAECRPYFFFDIQADWLMLPLNLTHEPGGRFSIVPLHVKQLPLKLWFLGEIFHLLPINNARPHFSVLTKNKLAKNQHQQRKCCRERKVFVRGTHNACQHVRCLEAFLLSVNRSLQLKQIPVF